MREPLLLFVLGLMIMGLPSKARDGASPNNPHPKAFSQGVSE
jgi:hypothetical protein